MSANHPQKPEIYRLAYVGRSSAEIERDFGARLSRLIREGFEVHILCGDDGAIGALSARGALCTPLPVTNPANIAGLLGAYFIMQAYFIEHRPVLVHTFDMPLALVGALAAALADVTVIMTSIEAHHLENRRLVKWLSKFEDRLARIISAPADLVGVSLREKLAERFAPIPSARGLSIYRVLAAMVDKYLVHNEEDLHIVQAMELVPPSKLEIIVGARGVDLSRFDLNAEDFWTQSTARQALNLPRVWREVLGFRGMIQDLREFEDLLKLIDDISRSHPSAGWILDIDLSTIGLSAENLATGNRAPTRLPLITSRRARRARRALGAHIRSGRVRVLGNHSALPHEGILDDPAVFYRALDVFIAPNYQATAPGPLMEAAAARIGALAYRHPTTQAAIEHGQTGELIEVGDVAGLVEATRRVLDAPNLRESYGRRARALALRHFNRQHVEDQVFRIYDTTLEMKFMP